MECGDALRPFRLASTIEEFLDANDCVGASLVVIFYLRDGSEDDSKLLSGFRDLQDQFEKLNVNLAASTKTSSGLYYRDLVPGTGNTADPGDTLSVYYHGYLSNGTQFDGLSAPKDPFQFILGIGRVIPGWD